MYVHDLSVLHIQCDEIAFSTGIHLSRITGGGSQSIKKLKDEINAIRYVSLPLSSEGCHSCSYLCGL